MFVPESWWLLSFGVTLLTAAAVVGYRVGRRRTRRQRADQLEPRTEIQRASAVIDELEGIAFRLQKAIVQHAKATRRYTARLVKCERSVPRSDHDLCDSAEEMLKQANRFTAEISYAYANLLQQMSHLSAFTELRTDPLTGAATRQVLDESLNELLSKQSRHSLPTSLAAIDIDYFTQHNETHNVLHGDRVLVALVELLRRSIRPCDLLARYGGEKFVVAMPQTEASVAAELIEAVRHAVQSKLPVTISAGLAVSAPGDTCGTLFNRAESALAKAKGAGRNCVFLHEGTLGRIVGFESKALQERQTSAARQALPQAAQTATLDKTLVDVATR